MSNAHARQVEATPPEAAADEALREALDRLEGIPTLSATVQRVLDVVSDPNSDARTLATAVQADPAVSLRLLRMVNSSFYGLASPVSDVDRAVVLLGFNTVKQLALGVSVMDAFDDGRDHDHFDGPALWTRSLATAAAMRLVEGRDGRRAPEDSFTLGLLHGVGRVVLWHCLPDGFIRAARMEEETGDDLIACQREVLGFDETHVGWIACRAWSLPDIVGMACRRHLQTPDEAAASGLDPALADRHRALHASVRLVRGSLTGDGAARRHLRAAANVLGCIESDVRALGEEAVTLGRQAWKAMA